MGNEDNIFDPFLKRNTKLTDGQHDRFCGGTTPSCVPGSWHAGPRLCRLNKTSDWPNPKHRLTAEAASARRLHHTRSFAINTATVLTQARIRTIITAAWMRGNDCQVHIHGRKNNKTLTSNRLRETPFTSFPMSGRWRLPTQWIRCRRSEKQTRALYLPSPLHDYHATVLSVAPGLRRRWFSSRDADFVIAHGLQEATGTSQPMSQWSLFCSVRPHLLLPPVQPSSIHTKARQEYELAAHHGAGTTPTCLRNNKYNDALGHD